MSDGTIMYFCELCGGGVDVEDVPDDWDGDTSPHVCEMCLPLLALPLTDAQRDQVVEWMLDGLAMPEDTRHDTGETNGGLSPEQGA